MAKADRAIPPGHVLIRLDDLAWLLAAARPPDAGQAAAASPAPGGPPGSTAAAWPALSVAIALLTSRIGRAGVSDADLIGGVPADAVIRALATIAVRALECAFPDRTTITVLQNLGVAAARGDSDGAE